MPEALIQVGDIISIGDDPQLFRCDETVDHNGIRAWRLTPVRSDGTDMPPQEYIVALNARLGRVDDVADDEYCDLAAMKES